MRAVYPFFSGLDNCFAFCSYHVGLDVSLLFSYRHFLLRNSSDFANIMRSLDVWITCCH